MKELIAFPCKGAYPEQQLTEPVQVTLSEGVFGQRRLGCPLATLSSGNYVYCGATVTSQAPQEELERQGRLRFCPHKHPITSN